MFPPLTTSSTADPRVLRPRPWKLSWFLRLSVGLHVAALIVVISEPALWPVALAALVADHLVIAATVFQPRSRLFGPNLVRLPATAIARREVAISFDDGPDAEVTPKVLDLLDRYEAKATFFCVASRAQAQPELIREILRRGHDVQNHSFSHAHSFPARGPFFARQEIGRAQSTLLSLTGRAATLFRAPMGFRSPFLEPALATHGLRFVSWTRRGFDTREKDSAKVLARLTCGLAAGDILLLHDRGSAVSNEGQPVVLDVLPVLLETLRSRGLRPVSLIMAIEEGGAVNEPAADSNFGRRGKAG